MSATTGDNDDNGAADQRPPPQPWHAARVSMVKSAPETNTIPVTVSAILEGIRNGHWQDPSSASKRGI